MDLIKCYTGNKFGLVIDTRSMADHAMHGNGLKIENVEGRIQLELQRDLDSGGSDVNCHVFAIADSQVNIKERKFLSVQYY